MLPESHIDYLRPFIEATVASAARFRRVLIVLIVASVLVFGVFWNARKGSWFNSRLELVQTAENVLLSREVNEELSKLNQGLVDKTIALERVGSEAERISIVAEQKRLNDDRQQKMQRLNDLEANLRGHDLASANEWIGMARVTSSDQLKPLHELLNSAKMNNIILFRIPFFGTVFDVNELGLLGGFTFVVILMWFRFSLWREYFNLCSTFNEARTVDDLETCYKYLAMSQVLTVPPTLSNRQHQERPWGKVVRCLYLLPVGVLTAVVAYDCYSFQTGWVVSKFNTVVSISASVCFLVLGVLLTFWCFRLSNEIDQEWENRSEQIKKGQTTGTVLSPSPTYFRRVSSSQ